MNRSTGAAIAREMLAILESGRYRPPGGGEVDLSGDLARAVSRTRLYGPGDLPGDPSPPEGVDRPGTAVEVTGETTLEAARRLAESFGVEPLCLNFASARNPGGGFLNGARAQEESLARSSGLYACIAPVEGFYRPHRAGRSLLYSDRLIVSPGVPVFRDDGGTLLDRPHHVGFLTAAAANAGAMARNQPDELPRSPAVMRRRIALVCWAAHREGYDHLVLGAWGCGAFRNDPTLIARLFAEQLGPGGPWSGVFRRIVFAVYDPGRERPCFTAFERAIGGQSPEPLP